MRKRKQAWNGWIVCMKRSILTDGYGDIQVFRTKGKAKNYACD